MPDVLGPGQSGDAFKHAAELGVGLWGQLGGPPFNTSRGHDTENTSESGRASLVVGCTT